MAKLGGVYLLHELDDEAQQTDVHTNSRKAVVVGGGGGGVVVALARTPLRDRDVAPRRANMTTP